MSTPWSIVVTVTVTVTLTLTLTLTLGRDAFVANHQMPPFEKADWKGNADMAIETK